MQGTVATLAGVSFDGRRLYRQIVGETDLRAVALVLSVVVGASLLHKMPVAAPRIARSSPPVTLPMIASATAIVSNPYGELYIPDALQRPAQVLVPQQTPPEWAPAP